MTSVPKPLKFLRNQYDSLKLAYEKITDKVTKVLILYIILYMVKKYSKNLPLKEFCADIVSVLGMTISDKRECLKYRFLSSKETVGSWGHEYVR
jgi:26S proteasome regulatory subunit N1